MQTRHDIPLSTLTTMRLGGPASEVVAFSSKEDLENILSLATEQHRPYFVIGGGSNIIARDEPFDGIIMLSNIKGFEVLNDDGVTVTIRIGAGENWDETVERSVEMGLSGIEAMSAIPGTVGATPVQNVGAYGQEIADTLVEMEAYDTAAHKWVTLTNADCNFSYRNSILKDPIHRHHIITHITLNLSRTLPKPPFYDSLQRYFDEHDTKDFSPAIIREAVISIRGVKLPDPSKIANTGSFFKNPIVDHTKASELLEKNPDMPHFPLPDGRVKLAAGWLIEKSGLKGHSAHGFKTYENNALVVVNESATSYAQLDKFKQEITDTVNSRFGVILEQEPETL